MAFVDILGFREIVESMARDPERFELIRDVLKTIQRQEHEVTRERMAVQRAERQVSRGTVSLVPPSRPEMTAFSDCYVISNKAESAWHVLLMVQAMAAFLLYKGILLRGGVVRGKAYHRGRLLFGPAIIAAYELQEYTAKYPRIVVEDRLVRSEWYLRQKAEGQFFLRDADGCWFVNPLERGLSRLSALLPELRADRAESDFFERVRAQIVRLLSGEMRNRRRNWDRIAKLRWVANRFNDAVSTNPARGVPVIDLAGPRVLAGASALMRNNKALQAAIDTGPCLSRRSVSS